MMKEKKIKIFLQYPWKYSDSSYYRNLINSPLENVDYLNKGKFKIIDSGFGFNLNKAIKEPIRKILGLFKIPNIVYTKNSEAEIIHCAHCLSLNKKPWIVDFERYETLGATGEIAQSKFGIKIIKKFLKSENCKKILPWTDAAKNSLLKYIKDKDILEKIEFLPFALPVKKLKRKKGNKEINILFIARYFEPKGGYVAVEVINYLTKKYKNVFGVIVSETPKDILKRYKSNKKIKFYDLMPQDKLFKEIYGNSDIFFYPGFSDSFGFALVEALSFGLPIITFDGFARNEIVEEGKNGYIISKKERKDPTWIRFRRNPQGIYLRQAIEKTEKLILNLKLRKRFGNYGYNMVKNGKFSIKNRDKILKKIYGEAL